MHKAPQLDQGECQHLILIQVPSAACSGRGPLGRPSRLLWRWNEQVGGHTEACTQSLHHRHAQFLLAPKDLADPAWRSEDWDHVRPREAVLIHEVPDQFRGARWSARPLALLIGSDQTRLCLQPSHVGGIVRAPQPINEGARAREFRIAIDHDQSCIHHTVSASILSYSAWLPKNRLLTAAQLGPSYRRPLRRVGKTCPRLRPMAA